MPKIELSALKGLKQSAGQGFCDADMQSHAANIDLSVDGTAAQKGALIHLATAEATITLPKASAGAVKGQIKIIISTVAANITIKCYSNDNDAAPADTTLGILDGAGDFAICVFNGTTWVAGVSLT